MVQVHGAANHWSASVGRSRWRFNGDGVGMSNGTKSLGGIVDVGKSSESGTNLDGRAGG
jgi:hypothetical protein